MRAYLAVFFLLILISCQEDVPKQMDYVCTECAAHLPESKAFSQETGYLQNTNGKLFYWFVKAKKNPESAPVVMWLNGGPGSSSLIGLFFENGPYRLNSDLSIYESPYAWNENANMLYIDQPIDVGFSLVTQDSGLPRDEKQVAQEMTESLQNFFAKHPELQRKNPFYIFGESFAGTYIPWMAVSLLKLNEANPAQAINLKGVGIGDGTVDMMSSWQTMPAYAFSKNLITKREQEQLERGAWRQCQEDIKKDLETPGPSKWPDVCWRILNQIKMLAANINVYDIRRFGSDYDFSILEYYLNQDSVKKFLNVEAGVKWHEDTEAIFARLYSDDIHSTLWKLRDILAKNVRVLIYSGDQDLLINYIGTEKWLDRLAKGNEKYLPINPWLNEKLTDFKLEERLAGKIRVGSNLSYVRIFEAGHLVPMDQPVLAKQILERFILEKPLVD